MQEYSFDDMAAAGLSRIVAPLLAWYDACGRVLPWRADVDPYHVWVSEIMLQQTQVETVRPYYERFIREVPDIASLAGLPEAQLLKLWEGLGYYTRARNLQKAARLIMERYGGTFPDRYDDIRALPGIGDYTAGAIASIAFGQPVPAVDGNVLRVMARLTGCRADIANPKTKKLFVRLLGEIYPKERCGDFTQSLMELGATVCLPNRPPLCGQCPIAGFCRARREGSQGELPVKGKKAPRKTEDKTVFILICGGRLALCVRQSGGLLGGLWELPNQSGHLAEKAAVAALEKWGVPPVSITPGPSHKHVFTHIEWRMKSYIVHCAAPAGGFVWATGEMLADEMAIPSAFRPFLRAFLNGREES